jgi:hypothetical protein
MWLLRLALAVLVCLPGLAASKETRVEVMPSVMRAPGTYLAPALLIVPATAFAVRLSMNRLKFTEDGGELCFHYRLSLTLGTTWMSGAEGCAQPHKPGKKVEPSLSMQLTDVGNPERRLEVSMTIKGMAIEAPVYITWID